jgi:hypothetical protein
LRVSRALPYSEQPPFLFLPDSQIASSFLADHDQGSSDIAVQDALHLLLIYYLHVKKDERRNNDA